MNEAEEKRIEIEPGQLWEGRLPGCKGAMLALSLGPADKAGYTTCAVLENTLMNQYALHSLHDFPLASNGCWKLLG